MRKLKLKSEHLTVIDVAELSDIPAASGFTCTGNCQSFIQMCQSGIPCIGTGLVCS